MESRSFDQISFITSDNPMPTVEIQLESLENAGLSLEDVAAPVLAELADKSPQIKASVYQYGTNSCNFHDLGFSEFLIVAGSKEVLTQLKDTFTRPGVKSRYSDYLPTWRGRHLFHLEDGQLWQQNPDDLPTWDRIEPPASSDSFRIRVRTPSEVDESDEYDDDRWDDDEDEALEEDAYHSEDVVLTRTQNAARYRAARSDAKVGPIRSQIEKIFGLPEGSVALRGPDGRPLRADAYISTLRERWEEE